LLFVHCSVVLSQELYGISSFGSFGNYTANFQTLNVTSGVSTLLGSFANFTISDLGSAFVYTNTYNVLLDGADGSFSYASASITSGALLRTLPLSAYAVALNFDFNTNRTIVLSDYQNGTIGLSYLSGSTFITIASPNTGLQFLGGTNAVDSTHGISYFVAQNPDSLTYSLLHFDIKNGLELPSVSLSFNGWIAAVAYWNGTLWALNGGNVDSNITLVTINPSTGHITPVYTFTKYNGFVNDYVLCPSTGMYYISLTDDQFHDSAYIIGMSLSPVQIRSTAAFQGPVLAGLACA